MEIVRNSIEKNRESNRYYVLNGNVTEQKNYEEFVVKFTYGTVHRQHIYLNRLN